MITTNRADDQEPSLDARIKSAHDGAKLSQSRCWLYSAPDGRFRVYDANKREGTLYIGVTADLPRRIHEHREGTTKGFTQRYGLHRLVYYESFDDIRLAIQREKTIKHWPRAWKLALIHEINPEWDDLYERLNQ